MVDSDSVDEARDEEDTEDDAEESGGEMSESPLQLSSSPMCSSSVSRSRKLPLNWLLDLSYFSINLLQCSSSLAF